MISKLLPYRDVIIGAITVALVLGLYLYINSLKTQIKELQYNLKDSYIETANYKLESVRYKNALDNQNLYIDALKVSKEKAQEKLNKWKKQKPEIKYKTIVKIREVHSNDCKKIKSVIDGVRKLDYNSL